MALTDKLSAIGEAIRAKTGKEEKLRLDQMPGEIAGISGGSGSMALNGVVKQYKVNAGATVSAGDFVEFVTNYGGGTFADVEAVCMSSCKVDNDRVFVVYASASVIYGTVLKVARNDVTIGERITIASYTSSCGYVAAATVGNARVVVSYGGVARLLSIEGVNITEIGNSFSFSSGDFLSGNAVSIREDLVAIACAYNSGKYYPSVYLLRVNGAEIGLLAYKSYTTSTKLVDAYVVKLSANKIAFLHSNEDGVDLTILAVEDSGLREITTKNIYSYPYTVGYDQTGIRAAVLSENLLIVSYAPRSTGTYNEYKYHCFSAVSIDETGIKTSGAYSLGSSGKYAVGIGKLSDNTALLVYRSADDETAQVLKIEVTGTTVTQNKYDLGVALATVEKGISTLIPFSDDQMLLISNAGVKAIYRTLAVDAEGVSVHTGAEDVDIYVQPATSRQHNVGIAVTGGLEGDAVDVCVAGVLRSQTIHQNYYTSSAQEITSGTEFTASVNCAVGDLVVAAIATRDTLMVSNGWNLISTSGVNSTDTSNGQRLSWAWKFAESSVESITVTQASAQRLYINMVALQGATGVIDNGYAYRDDTASGVITVNKPDGLVLWGLSSNLWGQIAPYPLWTASNDARIIQLGTQTQSRLGVALDQSEDGSVTFQSGTNDTPVIVGCLTVQGMDKFHTATTHTWVE